MTLKVRVIGVIDTRERTRVAQTYEMDVTSYPRHGEDCTPGSIVWRRGKKFKTRYRAFRFDENGSPLMLNVSIDYHKNKRRWVVYLEGYGEFMVEREPINDGYTEIKQAKASMLRNVLDRLAAEA